jgi:hypothetical protein
MRGEIADRTIGIENARLFLTGFTVTKKFHEFTPLGG